MATAEESGVKLAAYLDLLSPDFVGAESAKNLLREMTVMLAGLKGYLDVSDEG